MSRLVSGLFALALAALFAGTLVAAQNFRRQAQLFPIVIGVVGLSLAAAQVVQEVRRSRAPGDDLEDRVDLPPPHPSPGKEGESAVDMLALIADREPAEAEPVPPEVLRRRTAAILGWILAFTLAIWFLGFSLAVPVATFAYLKVGARESWRVSGLFTVLLGVLFYVVFIQVVRIPFDEGMLFTLLPALEG